MNRTKKLRSIKVREDNPYGRILQQENEISALKRKIERYEARLESARAEHSKDTTRIGALERSLVFQKEIASPYVTWSPPTGEAELFNISVVMRPRYSDSPVDGEVGVAVLGIRTQLEHALRITKDVCPHLTITMSMDRLGPEELSDE